MTKTSLPCVIIGMKKNTNLQTKLPIVDAYHRFSFYFLILILVPIILGINFIYSFVEVDRSTFQMIVEKFAVNPGYFAPEPAERYSYLFVLGVVPLIIVLSLVFFSLEKYKVRFQKILQWCSEPKRLMQQNVVISFSCILLVLVSFYFEDYFYLKHTIVFSWQIILAILGAYYILKPNKIISAINFPNLTWFLVGLIGIFRSVIYVFDSTDFHALYTDGHFDVPFYSLVRAIWGGTLYSDCPNQYGMYGMFLAPIFKVINLTTFNYTIVMSGLSLISLLLIFYFLRYIYSNQWVAFLVWFAYFGAGFIFILEGKNFFSSNGMPFRLDPYFQFIPIRLIFPALMLFFSVLQDKFKNSRLILYIGSFILSLSLFWNLEMGLVVVLSWLLFQMYQNFGIKKIAQTFSKVLSSYILGFIFFILMFYLQYHSIFNFSTLIAFQDIFYISGFFMLPMPIFGSWVIIILFYIWGLIYSGYTWYNQVNDSKRNFIFLVSIFGAGFFSYYQGRSHLWVLPAVTLPGFIIGGYLLDFCIRENVKWISYLVAFINIVLVVSAVNNTGETKDDLVARIVDTDQIIASEFDSLRAWVKPGEKVIFLSFNMGVLHAETMTEPTMCTSFPELLFKKDLDYLLKFLNVQQPVPIIMDTVWLSLVKLKPEWIQLYNLILNRYDIETATPNKRFFKLKTKQ